MKQLAFLTMDEPADFVIDDDLALAPLAGLGWNTSVVSWRQDEIPWNEFDAVIIRSTWDYWNDVDLFVDVLTEINHQTGLANSLDMVRWNLEKTYLQELENQGAAIVPTLWPDEFPTDSLNSFGNALNFDEVVIKPVIGATGIDTFRLSLNTPRDKLVKLANLFKGRRFMVQRFMPAILTEGEYSLFFFNGQFSHAILKTPAENEFRSQDELGAKIQPVKPELDLLDAAARALAVIETPLYARIDLVRRRDGFAVMEFELIEPSLYLRTDPGAPTRFARAVDAWFVNWA